MRLHTLFSCQGLAEFAWGEVENAWENFEDTGMEHAGLSQYLSVGLIKDEAKKHLVFLQVFMCMCPWMCSQVNTVSVYVDLEVHTNRC